MSDGRLRLGVLDYAVAMGFLAYAASAVIIAICLIEMARPEQLHFSLTGGGALHATRMGTVFFVLFFSGFLAARYGKCRSIGWSSFLIAAGMVAAGLAHSYWALLPALMLLGLGQGVLEGLLNPVIQDLHPRDSGRYLNLLNAFWSIGVVGTMVLGGLILSWGVSWRVILIAIGVGSVLPGLLFLRHQGELPRRKPDRPKKTLRQLRHILTLRRFWNYFLMMVLAGAAEGAFTYWSASYIQRDFGATPRAAGCGAAIFSIGMIVTRLLIGGWVKQHQLMRFMMVSAVAAAVVGVLFPLMPTVYAVFGMLLLAGATISCFWPTLQSYAAEQLNADSTLIFILLSCAGIPGVGLVVFAMGALGDAIGLRLSFLLVPVTLIGLGVLIRRDARRYGA